MDLVCLGEAFTDLIFLGLRRLPRPGEELRTQRFTETVGGGAVITAVAAARMGLDVRVLSALGPNVAARLRAEGVSATNLGRPGEPTAITVAISTSRDRSFVTFNGVNDQLERRLAARIGEVRAPFVHFAFAPRDCARWATIVNRLRREGTTTSWDFGWHQDLTQRPGFQSLLKAVDYLFVNEQEAVMYSGAKALRSAFSVWRRRMRPTIIKLGARGSRWVDGTTDIRATVRRRRTVDTTGAGDAFNGAFLAALVRGLSPIACLREGNRVGAAVTQQPGGLDGLPAARPCLK